MSLKVKKLFYRWLAFVRIMWMVRHSVWDAANVPYTSWIFIMADNPHDCVYTYKKLNETFVMLKKNRDYQINNLKNES